jgi:hypothetical protein
VSAILESAFCGRKSKPALLSEAFTNFWNISCSSMEEPASGWPEKIQTCLVGSPADAVSMIDPILLAEDAAAVCNADVTMKQVDVMVSPNFDEPTDDEDALVFLESEDEHETTASQMPIRKHNLPAGSSISSDPSVVVGQLSHAFCTHSITPSQSVAVLSDSDEFVRRDFSLQRPTLIPAKVPLFTSTPPRRQKNFICTSPNVSSPFSTNATTILLVRNYAKANTSILRLSITFIFK